MENYDEKCLVSLLDCILCPFCGTEDWGIEMESESDLAKEIQGVFGGEPEETKKLECHCFNCENIFHIIICNSEEKIKIEKVSNH